MESTPKKTPVKITHFLSPSANDICILCHEVINISSNRRKLFCPDGTKSELCLEVEECLGESVKCTDFKIICRKCISKVQTCSKSLKEKLKNLETGRELVASTFLRTRTKRLSKFNEPETKKRLFEVETESRNAPSNRLLDFFSVDEPNLITRST